MAKTKHSSKTPKNEYGILVLRNISDQLGLDKPNYQKVRRMLLNGEVPIDILEEWVFEDAAVLSYFKVDYETVLAAASGGGHGTPPRGAARRKPKAAKNPLPRVAPRPTVSDSGPPSTPTSASTAPSTRTTASDSPTPTPDTPRDKKKSPSLVGNVGRGIVGAVAAGAVKTLFNTQRAGVGSILLSSIQEKLDRGNMNPVGATRAGQPTGVTAKHLIAPLKTVIEDMNKSQTLILDALKQQATQRESLLDRAKRLDAADMEARRTTEPPEPVREPAAEPITRDTPPTVEEEPVVESTEAQIEAVQAQQLILDRLVSIDDNVSKILSVLTTDRPSSENSDGKKSGGILSSLLKWGGSLVGVFGGMFKSIVGLLSAFPKLSGVLTVLGTAASGLVGAFSSVGKAALEIGAGIASKVKNLFTKTPTVSPDDINIRPPTPTPDAPDGGKKGLLGKAKNLLKKAGPKLLKKIPLVSIPFVMSAVADRFGAGDYLGAGGEALSGLLAQIPGVGTALSAATDVGMIARDMINEDEASKPESAATTAMINEDEASKPESAVTTAPSVSKEAYTGVEALTKDTEEMREAQRVAGTNIVAPTTIQNNSSQSQTVIPPNNGGTADKSRFIDRLYAFA